MDYLKFVEHHRATEADITIGCLPVDYERASDFGLMKIDDEGRILVRHGLLHLVSLGCWKAACLLGMCCNLSGGLARPWHAMAVRGPVLSDCKGTPVRVLATC